MAFTGNCCQPQTPICTSCLDGSGNPIPYPTSFTVTINATPAACDFDTIDLHGSGNNLRYLPIGGTINGTWCFSFVSCVSGLSGTDFLKYRVTLPRAIGVAYGSVSVPCNNGNQGSSPIISQLELTIARTQSVWFQNNRSDIGCPNWNINMSIRGIGNPYLYFGGTEYFYFNACEFGGLALTNNCIARSLPNLVTTQINLTHPSDGTPSSRNEYWLGNPSAGFNYNYYPLWTGGSATITPSSCSPCSTCANLPTSVTITLPNANSWNFSTGTNCSPSVTSFVLNKSTYTDASYDCSYGDDDALVCVGGKLCQVLFRHNRSSTPGWIILFRPGGVGIVAADYGETFSGAIHGNICDQFGTYPNRDISQVGLTPPASMVVS